MQTLRDGDDSSVASTEPQLDNGEPDGLQQVAVVGSTEANGSALAAFLQAWRTFAASKRERQLMARKAAAFARSRLPKAVPASSKKPPASSKATSKPAPPAQGDEAHAAMEFLQDDLRSRLRSLRLEAWAAAFASAAVCLMADVMQYTSGKQMRDELERSGAHTVPLHVCNALFAKKPTRTSQPAVDEATDLLDVVLGEKASDTGLPLVDTLTLRVDPNDRNELVLRDTWR